MPFIQNVSMIDIVKGNHKDAGDNAMLIQIVDPAYGFPKPYHSFKEVHQFEFLDLGDEYSDGLEEFRMSYKQAAYILLALHKAKENDMNVIVHCHAGLCRSGAVVEAGILLYGFEDTGKHRLPNAYIKNKLLTFSGYQSYLELWTGDRYK